VVDLARFGGIFLNVFLLLVTAVFAIAQGAGKSGPAADKQGPGAGAKTEASKGEATAPLTPELSRRIENEIRSRYNVPPQINLSLAPLAASEIKGYDDLVVTFTGGTHSTTHTFLVSKDRKTLAHLETMDISVDLMSKIDVKGRPVKGNPNAKVTVVYYDDFECPFCSRMHMTLFNNVFKDYADKVRVIFKD